MNHKIIGCALICALPYTAYAQSENQISLTGSIQTDWLLPENDDAIGAKKSDYNSDLLGNTYIGLNLESKYITAGLRFETMENPLPGFENEFDKESFSGTGLPFFQISGRYKWAELTAGTFYEQFGSGFILRAYEDRNLGIDNSILGGRLVLRPYKGVQVKALGGVQRYHFSWTDSYVMGADLELNFDQWIGGLSDNGHYLTFGVSGVSKHEDATTVLYTTTDYPVVTSHKLHLPENVGAMDVRLQYQKDGYNILGEYAIKANDPTADNGYIYRKGQAVMLSASYSQSGFSALVQAKRSENMGFRSQRDMNPTTTSCYINHQPAFAYQHTYALTSLYPYGTQMDGEWAIQTEVAYKFKRNTVLGGKYGTLFKLNASHIRGLDTTPVASILGDGNMVGTNGYTSSFFGMTDDVYYQDINFSMEKKLSKEWKLTAMYMNQQYNQEIIEGHANNGKIIKSNIGVIEAKWQANTKVSLRGEVQYLQTNQDQGDWSFALLEMSLQPHWMFTISDLYNHGEIWDLWHDSEHHTHYVTGNVVYAIGANRIQLGYGRTREGLNCNGGVCRKVPASRGFTLSYNYNF